MNARPLVALAVALTLAASASTSSSKGRDDDDGPKGSRKGSDGGGFDGQIEVPAPFARGSAFLLMGDDDCRFLFPRWMGMAVDTRDREERASGVRSPGFPIACAKSGAQLTCKVFKHGFTAAFVADVKTDTATELRFGTSGGYIDTVIDLQKRTATFKQTAPSGKSTVCETKYKSREDAADDVAKLDPPPAAALPAKDRPNGMSSGGDRLKCKSRNDSRAEADPLTGRRAPVCAACTEKCWYVGEECKAGVCVYTGKGDTRGDSDSSSSSSSASSSSRGGGKPKGLERGRMCSKGKECQSGSCKMENKTRGRCQ